MPRPINLRQIEIFKAVIEHGTVSQAAEVMAISQPAASKLLVNLEADTELKLFDRKKGRLLPTPSAFKLHEEIDRIFASVGQVERAVENIKQEALGQLSIGVIPALSDIFVQRATSEFISANPKVECAIQPLSAHWIAETLRTHRIDMGLTSVAPSDPNLIAKNLSEDALVCILPVNHPLSSKTIIQPDDLQDQAFVSFISDSLIGGRIQAMLEKFDVTVNRVVTTAASTTLKQFVIAGQGISLVQPLFIADVLDKLVVRPFIPSLPIPLFACFPAAARNLGLVENYSAECLKQAKLISMEVKDRSSV